MNSERRLISSMMCFSVMYLAANQQEIMKRIEKHTAVIVIKVSTATISENDKEAT